MRVCGHTFRMPGQQRTGSLTRLSEIGRVATRHGFGYVLDRRRHSNDASASDRGRRLREMLDELGPTFVKFGQVLSTRPDVVPPDIVAELRKLQDDVRPVPFSQVSELIEAELGLTVEQAFLDFDVEPVAAASIGQVHRATLPNGLPVAVKVQRPGAPRQIESDLHLMRAAAKIVKERVHALDFIDAEALVEEFARSIREELDFLHEARNAETFHRNFGGDERVAVPRVWWRYTTGRVLTMDWLDGTQVADLETEGWSDEERRELAYRITDAWMTMIFRHGFFHGDPHPANIMLLEDGRIGLVDFGLSGRLTDEDMARMTRLFVEAATENVDALPRRLADLGVRFPRELEDQLRARLEELFYRYYGQSLSDIDPLEVIRESFALIYEMNLQLPTRFVILDKALATLGSVGVELYPGFNVFEVARPYARRLVQERLSPRRLAMRAQKETRELLGLARELPYQVHDVLEDARHGRLELTFRNPGLDHLEDRLDHAVNRLAVALVILGGLVGSSIVGVLADRGPHVFGLHVIAFFGFTISAGFGVWLVWGVLRSGRL
ncbi:MAG: AarF/ABC1/UbiB kinase family protein [Actinobacteria bacterium]|nr:AarF/ABC1/UbiB kinase family protein [Actinomycetota bacterium]